MTVIALVEMDTIRSYMDSLQTLDKKWASNLAKRMSKKDKSISKQAIYSIVSGKRFHQTDRVLFVECAMEYLKELNSKQLEVLNKIKTNQ